MNWWRKTTWRICGRLAREGRKKERGGGSEDRRKKSGVQSCEPPESHEKKLQECCIQNESWADCEGKSNGFVRDPAREFCSV